jgi:hypothetical protein
MPFLDLIGTNGGWFVFGPYIPNQSRYIVKSTLTIRLWAITQSNINEVFNMIMLDYSKPSDKVDLIGVDWLFRPRRMATYGLAFLSPQGGPYW